MQGFVRKSLRISPFFFWLFLGTTFADAANLDDLILPGIVLHDDEDATALGTRQLPAQNAPLPSRGGATHSAKVLRIFVDQDSPSLAADADTPALTTQILYETESPVSAVFHIALEPLHIRLRTLLL